MILGKTYSELLDIAFLRLVSSGTITNLSKGGIARTLTEVFCELVTGVYEDLNLALTMSYLSSATGNNIDLIGYMLNCTRLDGESDENYKYRITQQVYVAVGANETSIRLKCLSIQGVRDIVIKEYTRGTGSFSIYVIPESSQDINTILPIVQATIEENKGLGIRGAAISPKLIPIDMTIRLISKDSSLPDRIKNDVRYQIAYYIESLSVGDPLIITELIQRIMDTSDYIQDIQFLELYVSGKQSLFVNQTCYWDEKFYPNEIVVI